MNNNKSDPMYIIRCPGSSCLLKSILRMFSSLAPSFYLQSYVFGGEEKIKQSVFVVVVFSLPRKPTDTQLN